MSPPMPSARYVAALIALTLCIACAGVGPIQPRESLKSKDSVAFVVRCYPVDVGVPSRPFYENTYLAFDPRNAEALIVDPGTRSVGMEDFVTRHALRVLAILNTHGHRDHIGGDCYYSGKYRAPVYAHAGDKEFFAKMPCAVHYFEHEEILEIGGVEIRVLHTPGHSPGSVGFFVRGVLFSGDTLFAGGIGRTWADTNEDAWRLKKEEMANIRNVFFVLPAETPVYPGHDEATTIGDEKEKNPYFQYHIE